ncbi:MAG: mycofactocin biosynthesis glycosyltransferase MftF [Acidimicrobiales bacterium]
MVDRLVGAGAAPARDVGDVTARGERIDVVVPVRDRPEALDRCLAALVASNAGRVVVVDDGSVDAVGHRSVAEAHGATLVRLERHGGPAGARRAGYAATTTDLVAFVDSDIEVTPEWPGALLAHFDAPDVGVVAPRVAHESSAVRPGVVDRYEAASSPLDLGDRPAPIAAGTRVSYVPAAALVVRRTAYDAVGGFDPDLLVGEDVDLLWRLADAGWRGRYEPAVTVGHRGRSDVVSMLRRRVDYGRSAAELDLRHPGALPPLRGSRWSVAVVGLAAAGHPVAALGLAGWTVAAMRRKLGALDDASAVSLRLVALGHLGFARQVARASVRPWLPFTLVAALVSRRARRLAAVAILVEPLTSWRRRRPDVGLPAWSALSLADDVAYSVGVWAGCIRRRSWGALRPEIG